MSAQEFARDEPDMDFQNYKRNIKSHFYTCNRLYNFIISKQKIKEIVI